MIFIANALPINGGSTFLIRICRELSNRGIKTAVLVLFSPIDSGLNDELNKYSKVFYLKDFLWDRGVIFRQQFSIFSPIFWNRLFATLSPYGDSVHVMGIFGLLFASRLVSKFSQFKVTIGVYHQNEYLFQASKSFFFKYIRNLIQSVPSNNYLFFNEINSENYSTFFSRNFSSSLIAPIGIDTPLHSSNSKNTPIPYRIVSVGNLVNFKTYNRYVISTLPSLISKHPDTHYHIYGTGSEESSLRNLVAELNLDSKVTFFGALNYSDFSKTVSTATVFIGSGTAILEAAILGVPSVVGIESLQSPKTYGYLSDVKGYSYNEYMSNLPLYEFHDLIDDLFSEKTKYNDISLECKNKAMTFTINRTADVFLMLCKNSSKWKISTNHFKQITLTFSFSFVALLDAFNLSTDFRNRRNQSFSQ